MKSNSVEKLLKMRNDRDATVVITTHDREQAERLEGSLIVMKDGRISYQDPRSLSNAAPTKGAI